MQKEKKKKKKKGYLGAHDLARENCVHSDMKVGPDKDDRLEVNGEVGLALRPARSRVGFMGLLF